jgi:uncharacterized membrane protein HdeD (DUF308 family)
MADQFKYPSYLRAIQIGIELATVVAAILILLYPTLAMFALVSLLAFALFILGLGKIVIGVAGKYLKKSARAASVGLGILAICLGVLALTQPMFTSAVIIGLISFGLMFIGISTILHGVIHKAHSRVSRTFDIGIGIITVVISIMAIANPSFGIVFLIVLITTGFLIVGIESIIAGVFGSKKRLGYTIR